MRAASYAECKLYMDIENKKKLIRRILALVFLLGCIFMAIERYIMKAVMDYYYPDSNHEVFYFVSAFWVFLGVYFLVVLIKGKFNLLNRK